ncbi:MAG TPA: IPT/TIG domain-containing protein [Pyrinomonadaceae bacterium]|jgi:transcriptional regulator with XRE-family HTH domain/pyrrolidone-carboxylate peptidase
MSENDPQPELPIAPGNGDDDPPIQTPRITSVSPIGGALAGGIDVTINGSGFQPGAEVFFGSNQSPEVHFVSSARVTARLPQAEQVGSVDVGLVNPDGGSATKPGAFTYVTNADSLYAEVLGIEPLTVIEDTESELTIRGRNLIAAYNEGIVALRGSSRVQVAYSGFSSSTDEASGIDTLILTVRVMATPPLEQYERKAIQVLASLRPGAATDGVFQTSRQMFTVLPRAVPVLLAFTGSVDPSKPNLVMVAGRNLEGCSLDMGEGVSLHMQKSDDQTVAAIVSFLENVPVPESAQLRVLDSVGSEMSQIAMSVAVSPSVESRAAKSPAGDSPMSAPVDGDPDISGDENGALALTMTPFPGQQIVGPTATDSVIFPARGESLSLFSFNFGDFYIRIFERTFRIQLFNEVRLVPFFDNGVGDALSHTPVLAQVGKLFRLRGMGLLVALHVELIIHIEIVLIIGFRYRISPFSLFNEFFDDYPFAIGSLVISIRFALLVDIDFIVAFVVALVQPGGSLKVLFSFNLRVNIDFSIDSNGHFNFRTRFKHKVHFLRLGPIQNQPLVCNGRFQLAEDRGQSVFTDSFGGQVSYYMPLEAGPCCIPWDFGLELIRFEDGGDEQIIQGRFRAEYCLSAQASENLMKVVIVSGRTPDGFPPPLQLNLAETDTITALGQPVDDAGNPIPNRERIDLSEIGRVEFYLVFPNKNVLEPDLLTPGDALAVEAGDNVIAAKVTTSRVVDPPPGEEPPEFSFWPGGVLGFDILSFLARGLMPAVKAGDLPVIVSAPVAGELTISLTLVYQDESSPPKLIPTSILERNEPFEIQRDYLLQARIVLGGGVTQEQTLTFKVDSVSMAAPLAGLGFGRNRNSNNPELFFTGTLAQSGSHVTVNLRGKDLSKPIVVAGLTIKPNNLEVGTITSRNSPLDKLVPPGRAVNNADTEVNIRLSVTSDDANTKVRIAQPLPDLTVINNETFEEYLRVFKEVQNILQSSDLENFEVSFDADLLDQGRDIDRIRTYVQQQGAALWKAALEEVRTHAQRKDDRPLYWARLRCIAALRAYFKRQRLPLSDSIIQQFEWPSRGLDADGRISFSSSAGPRKGVITGFDPFGLRREVDASNPSGVIALEFNGKTLGASPAVSFRTAVFPVRFKDFNDGLVENALPRDLLASIVMLLTISQNGDQNFYDIERWAARTRGAGTDNNNKRETPVVMPPGAEFLQSTLPFRTVITKAEEVASPSATGSAPFVIDQSYSIDSVAESISVNRKVPPDKPENRVMAVPPNFRPEPLLDDKDKAAFTVINDAPDPKQTSQEGSGGNFLSNEIFYRAALARNSAKPTLASGHLHVPPLVEPTTQNPITAQRDRLLNGTKGIVERLIAHLILAPEITSFFPASGRTGTRVTIFGANFTGATAVRIGGGDVDFVVDGDSQITATVTLDAVTGVIEVETPAGTAVSENFFIVNRRPIRGDLGAQLVERRAELGLSVADAATRIGAKPATYRRWERGQDQPSARFKPAVTSFLGQDPDPDPREFGESIRAARERDGLTRSQLARQLGVSSSTVRAWEDGAVSRPSPRVASIFDEYLSEE